MKNTQKSHRTQNSILSKLLELKYWYTLNCDNALIKEYVVFAKDIISNFNCNMDLLHNLISKLKVKLYMKANILNL